MADKRRDPIAMQLEKNKRRNIEIAERAAKAGNLPSNWGSAVAENGQRYYFDAETKEGVTWDPPIDEMVSLLEQQQREEMEEMIKNASAVERSKQWGLGEPGWPGARV